MPKITDIGGSGFVGTNFCRFLADHQIPFEIVNLKPSQSFPERCRTGDVLDLDSLWVAVTGDVVVNLAVVHRDDSLADGINRTLQSEFVTPDLDREIFYTV